MAKNPEIYNIDFETLSKYREIKERHENGEEIDPETIEGLKALELANQIMNSIMAGGQVDPVFLKKISDVAEGKLTATEALKKRKVKKKRKFKIKK